MAAGGPKSLSLLAAGQRQRKRCFASFALVRHRRLRAVPQRARVVRPVMVSVRAGAPRWQLRVLAASQQELAVGTNHSTKCVRHCSVLVNSKIV